MNIAVIGCGLSGAIFAHKVSALHDVTIFEKARGVGGRMSTRYVTLDNGDHVEFDHGAQFFTARDPAFIDFLKPCIAQKIVSPWSPRILIQDERGKWQESPWQETHYTAVPRMNTLVKNISQSVDVRVGVHIEILQRNAGGWVLIDKEGVKHGPYDWVVSTAPVTQSNQLIPKTFKHRSTLQSATMLPCFALMLCMQKIAMPFEACFLRQGPFHWITQNGHKPGRPRGAYTTLVAQTTPEWSLAHESVEKSACEEILRKALVGVLGQPITPIHQALHFWRYASVSSKALSEPLLDRENCLAVCGDWTEGGRVEGAFLSAYKLSRLFV